MLHYHVSMKTCTKCKESKAHSEFHKRARAKDGLQSWCKVCSIAARLETYRSSPENMQATRDSALKSQIRNRDYLVELLLRSSCLDCGETDLVVLHFDHVRGPKVGEVSKLARRGVSLTTLQEEIDKCEIVCANCHMRRTSKQFNWFKASIHDLENK
jgi:hypothetical protein